jgi:hypothetical protein
MGTIISGLAAIAAIIANSRQILGLIMDVVRMFQKTPQEKVDKATQKEDEREKHLDETGRPKWD